jgi:hypothetical protein
MTDLPIWAQDKAREWLMTECAGHPDIYYPLFNSLAALLVEVEEQEHACGDHIKARLDEQMAEVRRVVSTLKVEYTSGTNGCADACLCCDEILARIEKL